MMAPQIVDLIFYLLHFKSYWIIGQFFKRNVLQQISTSQVNPKTLKLSSVSTFFSLFLHLWLTSSLVFVFSSAAHSKQHAADALTNLFKWQNTFNSHKNAK